MDMLKQAYERYKVYRGKAKGLYNAQAFSYQPPNRQEIIAIQKQQIKQFQERFTTEQLNLLSQIMGIVPAYQPSFEAEVTKKLDLIENWAASLYTNKNYLKTNLEKASSAQLKILYNNLLIHWQQILTILNQSGSVNPQAKAQLEKFRSSVIALEQGVNKGVPVDYNIISRAMSAANFAKGYVLEQEGKDFYEKILKDLDVEVVSTGQMKSMRGDKGGAVDLSSDLVIVSKSAEYNGLSLHEFLNKVEYTDQSKSIILGDVEQGLLEQGIAIQAKASRNRLVRVKNTNTTVNTWRQWAEEDNTAHGLMLQVLLSTKGEGVYKTHPEYAAIGNYIFSKKLAEYLHGNMLYLLRDGLYDTYSLFNDQLSKNNYTQILNGQLHLAKGSGAIGLRIF